MRVKLLIAVLVLLSFCVNSQVDTEFWFTIPEASDLHGDEPLLVRISTLDYSSKVTLSQPANPDFEPIILNIPSNSTETIDLTSRKEWVETRPPNAILKTGLFIEATQPITAYYDLASGGNPEIFTLKGRNAIGNKFIIPSQNQYPNAFGKERVDVVATENNSEITIVPQCDVVGHEDSIPFRITLNMGESYCIQAVSSSNMTSLGGTIITSKKPVAVMISDDSLDALLRGWDMIGDQIVPVDYLGTEYIVVKGFDEMHDDIFVTAIEDNTSIYLDGDQSPYISLESGCCCNISLENTTAYITSNKPVVVYQVTGAGIHELASAAIPRLHCTGSEKTGFVRINNRIFIMLLICRSGVEDGFVLNGHSDYINSDDFSPVPGTEGNYVFMHKEMSLQEVPEEEGSVLYNDKGHFQLGIIMPWKDEEGWVSSTFGYFSDFSSLNIGIDKTICPGDSLLLEVESDMDSYVWNTGETSEAIYAKDSGLYYVDVTFDEICHLSDSIKVSMYTSPYVNLGNDTVIENGTPFLLDAGPGFDSYLWQDGSDEQTYWPSTVGKYWVRVVDTNGCMASDDIFLSSLFNIYMPNAFTPNGDGINDDFKPVITSPFFLYYSFKVFNRWGELIFSSDQPETGWDGTKNGEKCPAGAYVWTLKCEYYESNQQTNQSFRGNVTLLR